jgi:LmbE family N-acetylglucosaminyl deacetylase
LAELNPLALEDEVAAHIHEVEPDVVVTYPVHGISGHPDHLVSHAVVKRVVCALRRDGVAYPKRLAFFTVPPPSDDADRPSHLQHSPSVLIDCVVPTADEDLERGREALYCYETYRPVIEEHQPLRSVTDSTSLELFGEHHAPPLASLLDGLDDDAEPLFSVSDPSAA